ncbi:MAG: hypothetical protein JKX76_02890 [Colwellia sp.]|nr:hypothetical protein [Colwellia sp.]
MGSKDYGRLTPTEVYEKYPEFKELFGWGPREIGLLASLRIFDGRYNTTLKKTEIYEDSILEVVQLLSKRHDRKGTIMKRIYIENSHS